MQDKEEPSVPPRDGLESELKYLDHLKHCHFNKQLSVQSVSL